jgi:myo-inositol-1(or 4)-monophosphatase
MPRNGIDERRIMRALLRAAREGGRIARRHFLSGRLEVTEKSAPGDLVSNADIEAERAVLAILHREFPRIAVVSEETENAGAGEETFYVDPIDGTLNFVHGLPPFAVSIGYWRGGAPAAAVVCNPLTGQIFSSLRGAGASCNGKALHVSRAGALRDALVAAGWPYDRTDRARLFRQMDGVYMASQELRTIGCASLGLCYVAAGIFDGYWEQGLKPWDMAAGALIVAEAGGRVSSLSGGAFRLSDGELAASNGLIHDELIHAVNGHVSPRPDQGPEAGPR